MKFLQSITSFFGTKSGAVLSASIFAAILFIPQVAFGFSVTDIVMDGLYFVFAMLIKLLIVIVDVVMLLIGFFMEKATETQDVVVTAWRLIRDFVNLAFIFVLIFAAIINIFSVDFDGFTLRDILPKIIYAAVMVNFSYLFVYLILDFADVMEATIYTQLTNGEVGPHGRGLAAAFENTLQYKNFDSSIEGASLDRLLRAITTVIMLGFLVMAFVPLLFVYVGRVFYIWVLAITSPFYFFTGAVPAFFTKEHDDWWGHMKKWGFIHVKLAFFLSLALAVAASVAESSEVGGEVAGTAAKVVQGPLSMETIMMYVMVVGMVALAVKEANSGLDSLPGPMANLGKAVAGKADNFVKGAGSYAVAKTAGAGIGVTKSLANPVLQQAGKATGAVTKKIKGAVASAGGPAATPNIIQKAASGSFTGLAATKAALGGILKGEGLRSLKKESRGATIAREKHKMTEGVKNTVKSKGVNLIRSVAADAQIEKMKQEDFINKVKRPFTGAGDVALEDAKNMRAGAEKKEENDNKKAIFESKDALNEKELKAMEKYANDLTAGTPEHTKAMEAVNKKEIEVRNFRLGRVNSIAKDKDAANKDKSLDDLKTEFKGLKGVEVRNGELFQNGKKADLDQATNIRSLIKAFTSKDLNSDNLKHLTSELGIVVKDAAGNTVQGNNLNDPAIVDQFSESFSKVMSTEKDNAKGLISSVPKTRTSKAEKDSKTFINDPNIVSQLEGLLDTAQNKQSKVQLETMVRVIGNKDVKRKLNDPSNAAVKNRVKAKITAIQNSAAGGALGTDFVDQANQLGQVKNAL